MSFFSDLGSFIQEANAFKEELSTVKNESTDSIRKTVIQTAESLNSSSREVKSTVDQAVQEVKDAKITDDKE